MRGRSDFLLEFFSGDLAVPENLRKESPPYGLAAVNRNNGASTVVVPKEMVAALDANHLESQSAQRLNELNSAKCAESTHAITATR